MINGSAVGRMSPPTGGAGQFRLIAPSVFRATSLVRLEGLLPLRRAVYGRIMGPGAFFDGGTFGDFLSGCRGRGVDPVELFISVPVACSLGFLAGKEWPATVPAI